MMPNDPTSLTPEERALAQRLARLGPNGELSPALDARILAAAHAAAIPSPRRRPRWPVALGVAASLALAIGLAWQLRPLPSSRPAYRSEAESATTTAAGNVSSQAASAAPERSPPASPAVQPDAPAVVLPPSVQERQSPEPSLAPTPEPQADAQTPVAFDAPSPPAAKASAPAPAVAPAPPAAPATREMATGPQAFGTTAAKTAADVAAGTGTQPENRVLHGAAIDAEQPQSAADQSAAGTARDDEPLDDVPPATADAPAVREAWLQRIRELADAGDIEAARASLQEFVHRYPAFSLPEDLRALER